MLGDVFVTMKAKTQHRFMNAKRGLANPVGNALPRFRELSAAGFSRQQQKDAIMKKRLAIILAIVPALAIVIPTPIRAQVSISGGVQVNTPGFSFQIGGNNDFYGPLGPYGNWVDYQGYGRCWHPTQAGPDWRPYSNGYWTYTDAGWYWNSDEPWAWACYHYGSWTFDSNLGWIWIPGTQWAPAWVTWRYSDNYVGWAPCGPNLVVLAPSFFVFCGAHDFGNHFHTHDLIVNNTTIINRTRVVRDFSRQTINVDGHERTIMANRGPGVDQIQRISGRTFTPRPVTDVVRSQRMPENMRNNQNRPGENRTPEQQRYNQEQRNQQQRPNENFNRENNPPPTGREQSRQQPYNGSQQQQQRQLEQQQQRQLEQQQQQQRPGATPPTGREQQRNYNQTPSQEQQRLNQEQQRQQQQRATPEATPSQRATPQERNLNPSGRENAAPSQRQQEAKPNQTPEQRSAPPSQQPSPSQRATPPEKNMPPTGRENPPPSQRPQEARPNQAPEQHAPPQPPPGQEKKDKQDQP
jgi:hypothetical protein